MHLLVRISEKKSRILLIPLGVILEYMWVRAEFCVLWFEQCIILPFAGSSMRRTIAKHWAFLTVSHLQFWICGRTGYMQYIWICPRKLHETLFFVMKKWGYNCTLFSSNFLVDFFPILKNFPTTNSTEKLGDRPGCPSSVLANTGNSSKLENILNKYPHWLIIVFDNICCSRFFIERGMNSNCKPRLGFHRNFNT